MKPSLSSTLAAIHLIASISSYLFAPDNVAVPIVS